MMIVPSLCAMEQPRKKQKIECSTNHFEQLPKEIIMHIFAYAIPSLQNKDFFKDKDYEKKIVVHWVALEPEEIFVQNLITYKNVSASCKQFDQLLKDDEGIINQMQYFKKFKKLRKEIRIKSQTQSQEPWWSDYWKISIDKM